jgi:ABC-type lipoprotein release transport system permease subunit
MTTLKVAFRNVFRQKRRTLLTVLTMTGGFALAAISIAWSDGTYSSVIDSFTRYQLGHIQIHGEGYLDRPTLYNTIDDYRLVGDRVARVSGVSNWAPRIYSAGIISAGERTAGVRIIGVDPELENQATRFDRKVIAGRTLNPSGRLETVLGKGLLESLRASVGDTVVLVSQAADGSMANDLYRIVGVIEVGNDVADQTAMYLNLDDAQELLVLGGRVHEMAVIIDELGEVGRVTDSIRTALNMPRLAVAPWQEFAKAFYTAMKADQQGTWIMLMIIILIVAVGVLNTVLMTVLERTREYGVLRAIGARPWQVARLVVYEVAVMALIAIAAGFIISLPVNYWLSLEGITFGTALSYGGQDFSTLYTEINVRSYTIPAVTVMLAALVVCLFPAARAARTDPARAMRTH